MLQVILSYSSLGCMKCIAGEQNMMMALKMVLLGTAEIPEVNLWRGGLGFKITNYIDYQLMETTDSKYNKLYTSTYMGMLFTSM